MALTDAERRAERAAYMRVWTARHKDRLNREKRERWQHDGAFARKRSSDTRLIELKKRGGVDDDTVSLLPVLRLDPCAYCGCEMVPNHRTAGDGAALDHIDPAGDSHWTNLAGCCRSCNAIKGDLPLLFSLLERQLRKDLTPIAEQVWIIKGRKGQRRRIDF